ncbi:hypothetical protein KFE25_000138 [Diacronema lutheri]|uniref:EF-hand domain-containing protein n=1 Tax=Diacronema lutheri TaxID=2081491 RepID=A0A8J6CBR4_DIALT|nr:hypothetical protein KFE25_000138 [Diacronema lutheri]
MATAVSNRAESPPPRAPGSVFISKASSGFVDSTMPQAQPQHADELLERMRAQLKARGAVGIHGLARNFRILDRNRSGSLDESEFLRLVQLCRLELSDADVHLLFGAFDVNRSGLIDYEEFLRQVRGPIPPARRNLVVKVFQALDSLGDGNGTLDVEDLKHAFDARSSPDVIAGRKSEREVLQEFVREFEGSSGNRDGVVTFDEWIRYYEEVSASMDSDDAFGAMVASVWSALKTLDASGREVAVIRYTSEHAINSLEKILRDKIWQKTTRAKNERKVLEDAFKQFDVDGSLSISLVEFARAMERFGLYASPDEIGGLFARYDADSDGVVHFHEFQAVLAGDDGHGVRATGTTLAVGGGAVQGAPQPARERRGVSPVPPAQPAVAPLLPTAPASRTGSSVLSAMAYSPQRPATAAGPGVGAGGNARVRSLANPERRTRNADPDYFKKSSGIFSD